MAAIMRQKMEFFSLRTLRHILGQRAVLFALCFCISVKVVYADETIDNKYQQIESTSGAQKLHLMLEVITEYSDSKPDLAISFEDEILQLASVYGDYNQQYQALFYLALTASNLNEGQKANGFFERAKRIAKSNGDDAKVADILREEALQAWYVSDFQKALSLISQNQEIYRRLGDISSLSRSLNNSGIMYRNLGQHAKALDYYMESLQLKESLGQQDKVAITLNNIGVLYDHMEDYPRAIGALKRSIKIYQELGSERDIADPFNNLGEVYKHQKEYELAEDYLLRSYEIEKRFHNVRGVALSNFTLGELYLEINNLDKASSYLQAALSTAEREGFKSLVSQATRSLSSYYSKLGQHSEAKEMAKYSYKVALETKSLDEQKSVLKVLADLYSSDGEFEQAFIYHKKYKLVSDELLEQANNKDVAVIRSNYDWQQQNNQIQLLQKENDIQALQLEQQTQQRYYFFIGVSALALVLFSFFSARVHKRELKQQKALNQKLQNLDQLKDQVLANTSHELLTPLNGIVGLAQAVDTKLKERLPPDQETQECIELIIKSGYMLAEQVKNILTHAKVHNNEQQYIFEPVTLSVVVATVVKTLTPLVKPDVQLINAIDDDMVEVQADKMALIQILNNLIGNAIKFTDKGTISINSKMQLKAIEIIIRDTGVGIPKDKLSSIFDSYQQVDGSYQRAYGGVGLGLTISKDMAESLGGSIRVESELGKGSTFYLTLPRVS